MIPYMSRVRKTFVIVLASSQFLFAYNGVAAAANGKEGITCTGPVDKRRPSRKPHQVVFELVKDGTYAYVMDGAISYVDGQPKLITVKTKQNGNMRIAWSLTVPTNQEYVATQTFRFEYNPKDLTAVYRTRIAAGGGVRTSINMTCMKTTLKSTFRLPRG